MATSTSTTTAVAGTGSLAPSIPQVQIKFLNSDGTVSLPWYRFLQGLTGNQSGIITNVSSVTTTVSEVVTTVSAVSSTANEALALAESNELLGFVGLSDGAMQGALSLTLGELLAVSQGSVAQPPNEAQALALTALGQLPPLDRSGAPYSPRPKPDLSLSALDAESIRALAASAQITSRVRSLNFGSNLTATSDHAGNVSLSATGGGSNLEVIANGTTLTTAATVLTFTGAGVTGSVAGTDATLTIPGASGALAAVSCSLSGTTITVDRSTNVASVTRTAAGRYRLTFTTALSTSTYGVAAIGQYPTESGVLPIAGIDATSGYGATTTTLDIAFETAAGVFADLAYFTVLVFDPANFIGGGASQGNYVYLGGQTVSSATEVDFTSLINASYDTYVVEFYDVVPSVNNVYLGLQLSTNNGSSWTTSGYSTSVTVWGLTTNYNAYTYLGSSSYIAITNQLLSTSAYSSQGFAKISGVNGTSLSKLCMAESVCNSSDGNVYLVKSGGSSNVSAAVNALRVIASSGAISGTFRLYGIAN